MGGGAGAGAGSTGGGAAAAGGLGVTGREFMDNLVGWLEGEGIFFFFFWFIYLFCLCRSCHFSFFNSLVEEVCEFCQRESSSLV